MGGFCLLSSCFGLWNPLFWSSEFPCEYIYIFYFFAEYGVEHFVHMFKHTAVLIRLGLTKVNTFVGVFVCLCVCACVVSV